MSPVLNGILQFWEHFKIHLQCGYWTWFHKIQQKNNILFQGKNDYDLPCKVGLCNFFLFWYNVALHKLKKFITNAEKNVSHPTVAVQKWLCSADGIFWCFFKYILINIFELSCTQSVITLFFSNSPTHCVLWVRKFHVLILLKWWVSLTFAFTWSIRLLYQTRVRPPFFVNNIHIAGIKLILPYLSFTYFVGS